MRELPILFSTPMVQAIMEGKKNQTRRTAGLKEVNESPDNWKLYNGDFNEKGQAFFNVIGSHSTRCKPRYQKGDHIWVKEQHYIYGYWILSGGTTPKKHKFEKIFIDCSQNKKLNKSYLFENNKPDKFRIDQDTSGIDYFKRPSLFMPKEISRIWFECTGVRCERLHDISEQDAMNEGVEKIGIDTPFEGYKEYFIKDMTIGISAKYSFFSIWMKLNGIESMQSNPWVFVYEFTKIDKPCSGQQIL